MFILLKNQFVTNNASNNCIFTVIKIYDKKFFTISGVKANHIFKCNSLYPYSAKYLAFRQNFYLN